MPRQNSHRRPLASHRFAAALADTFHIRSLAGDDAPVLAGFSCARPNEPWADAVDEMVQDLVGELGGDEIRAIGLWEGSELCGVAAWRRYPGTDMVRGDLVAVRVEHQGKQYGRRLKEAMLSAARDQGAAVMHSRVHRQNRWMLSINQQLGASIEEDLESDHLRCFIPLQRADPEDESGS